MGFPVTFVVFGATGDLMKRKALPSLFHLYQSKNLPEDFRILGVSRKKWSNAKFKNHVKTALRSHHDICSDCNPKLIKKFLTNFAYVSADITKKVDYKKISKAVHNNQSKSCSNTIFYLSTPPKIYSRVLKALKNSPLMTHCQDKWSRIIIEKPVGLDMKSFTHIKTALKGYQKKDLYFIDHYLGKGVLRQIKDFRQKNKLLKGLWNGKNIASIEVKLFESQGIDDRAPFYEVVGALRDVGQNHILEMIALVLMNLEGDIRKSRAKVIRSLKLDGKIKDAVYRAQYVGYTDEVGVSKTSKTETYFELKLKSGLPGWEHVPIFVSAGKGMGKSNKYIRLNFSNDEFISFDLSPKEGITSKLFITQRPTFTKITKKSLPYLEEYQKLLFDVMWGNRDNFVSLNEIEASWKLIDPIIKSWKKETALDKYSLNSLMGQKYQFTKNSIGFIGLGKMGAGLARQLLDKNWEVVGYNKTTSPTKALEKGGLVGSYSLKGLVSKLKQPRVVWLMVPQGKPVQELLFDKGGLITLLNKGDLVIDGGNSYYQDSVQTAKKLAKKGIKFMDVGVSGGPSGARNGASLMIGGRKKDFLIYEHLFRDLSVLGGYQFFSGYGAGHFVKMVHNGIEYGMMQAIAEGFTIMKKSKYHLNLLDVSRVYNHGSVIESNLINWLNTAFHFRTQSLKGVSGRVHHTGEGAWTVKTAKLMKLKAKVIEESLKYRIMSKKNDYTGKLVAALREQFGGHSVE